MSINRSMREHRRSRSKIEQKPPAKIEVSQGRKSTNPSPDPTHYNIPLSFNALCRSVSFTAVNTSCIFVRSVACVKLLDENGIALSVGHAMNMIPAEPFEVRRSRSNARGWNGEGQLSETSRRLTEDTHSASPYSPA